MTLAGGNPWVLLTSALAELLYSGATEIAQSNGAALTAEAQAKWADALGLSADHKARVGGAAFDMAEALAGAGDGVLLRLRHHVARDFTSTSRLPETLESAWPRRT